VRIYGLRSELKHLRPETLFIWANCDGAQRRGKERSAIAPHARCEVVRDAGHLAWLNQPERCVHLTIEFS
jgi:pimeloyl-ACP methyl ester carboxylesterase